jgi:hypothetical protein
MTSRGERAQRALVVADESGVQHDEQNFHG